MKFISSKAAFAMVMLPALVATILMTQSCGKSGDVDSLYRDPSQPVEARVNNLLSQMTLDEKIGQLNQLSMPYGEGALRICVTLCHEAKWVRYSMYPQPPCPTVFSEWQLTAPALEYPCCWLAM